jgi:hypothetical protein
VKSTPNAPQSIRCETEIDDDEWVLARTDANAVKIANGVITHFSNDCLGLSRGDIV